MFLLNVLNVLAVRGFEEAEYWFALIKVVTVIAFIGVGLLMIFGILKGRPSTGWSNFTIGDAPFAGRLPALTGVAMIVGFSFFLPALSYAWPKAVIFPDPFPGGLPIGADCARQIGDRCAHRASI